MNKFNKAMRILIAGFCINLCLGVLYAWSVFNKTLMSQEGWSAASASAPYAIATVAFALCVLFAGILQDKMGPRKILILGSSLTGIGMLASGFMLNPLALNITFGVITGAGIGFGYACLAPAAMKWFHLSKKGMVNGIITAGFGLAAVYLAPLTSFLITTFGLQQSFIILGVGILVIAVPLATTINNPPKNYQPEIPKNIVSNKKATSSTELSWNTMLKTPQFYFLWIMFALSASVGLMIIGNITSIASMQANLPNAVYLASLLAIFNSGGRVAAGLLADKIGGMRTLLLAFTLQGANMLMFATFNSEILLVIGTAVVALGYGTLLSVFPTITAEYYGLKNYGTNYGVIYTAWGMGGLIGSIIVGYSISSSQSYSIAYTIAATMMGLCIILALITKPIKTTQN